MPEDYKHLKIEREPNSNDRRRPPRNIPRQTRDDVSAHSQKLIADLTQTLDKAKEQLTSEEGSYILKINYSGSLTFDNLEKHGVEFVSHEDKQTCVVFSAEDGLTQFSEHLERLGLKDETLTYKQALEALDSIESWTEEDRKSWAIKHKGLPTDKIFKLDIEL